MPHTSMEDFIGWLGVLPLAGLSLHAVEDMEVRSKLPSILNFDDTIPRT